MTTPLQRDIGSVELPMVMEKGEVNLLLKTQAHRLIDCMDAYTCAGNVARKAATLA